jgi:hypothetical protein
MIGLLVLLGLGLGDRDRQAVLLYSRRTKSAAMDRFEQAFWSGQSIEELYRALSAKPTQSMAACFVRGDARVEALLRGGQCALVRRPAACASTR